jgi:hypothetical protein
VLDAVLVARDQAPGDAPIVGVLALLVEQRGARVETLDRALLTVTPRLRMMPLLSSIRPLVLLVLGDRFSVQLTNKARGARGRAQEGDAGCDAGTPIMDQYVEIELHGEDPSERFSGTAIHLRGGVARIMTGYSRLPGASAAQIPSSAVRPNAARALISVTTLHRGAQHERIKL